MDLETFELTLLKWLNEFKIPLEKVHVSHGGSMLMLGLIKETADIDLTVDKDVFDYFYSKKEYPKTRLDENWELISVTPDIDIHLAESDVHESQLLVSKNGIRFRNAERTLVDYGLLNRLKDQRRIDSLISYILKDNPTTIFVGEIHGFADGGKVQTTINKLIKQFKPDHIYHEFINHEDLMFDRLYKFSLKEMEYFYQNRGNDKICYPDWNELEFKMIIDNKIPISSNIDAPFGNYNESSPTFQLDREHYMVNMLKQGKVGETRNKVLVVVGGYHSAYGIRPDISGPNKGRLTYPESPLRLYIETLKAKYRNKVKDLQFIL